MAATVPLQKGQEVWALIPADNHTGMDSGQPVTILAFLPNGGLHVQGRGDWLVEGMEWYLERTEVFATKEELLNKHPGLTIPEHPESWDGWDWSVRMVDNVLGRLEQKVNDHNVVISARDESFQRSPIWHLKVEQIVDVLGGLELCDLYWALYWQDYKWGQGDKDPDYNAAAEWLYTKAAELRALDTWPAMVEQMKRLLTAADTSQLPASIPWQIREIVEKEHEK
jgi:hypothetical protein